jgi:hypothetical protein
MGISHAIRGASAGGPFPGTHDPSKPFPCTQPSYGCGATEIAPSPFVDARLTDHSAPPEARLLWAPRLASWPFTVGPTLSPLSLHLCSTAHAATLSNRSSCEPKLQTAVLANRSSSELASAARLAQPLDLRVSRHIQIRCTDTVFPPCPCPMLPWAFCSAHTVHEDLGTSEEVWGRPAAADSLRRQRREAEPPGADVMPDTERRAPSRAPTRTRRVGQRPERPSEEETRARNHPSWGRREASWGAVPTRGRKHHRQGRHQSERILHRSRRANLWWGAFAGSFNLSREAEGKNRRGRRACFSRQRTLGSASR